ncbi:MAG: metal ABC transporter ATP-binding protein [Candidatus Bipolaricaulota bacterium]
MTLHYDKRTALEDVSFDVPAGAHVAVVGPNGAGKSTLLKAVAGLLPWTQGTLRVYGHEPRDHLCIAYVPQRAAVDWRFPVTVLDVVLMGRVHRRGPLRRMTRRDRALAEAAVQWVGLGPQAGRQIAELSGGEQQKMFLARALSQEAELVLLDEPLAGIDASSEVEILDLLDRLSGTTLLVALHDLGIAAKHFSLALLVRGRLLGFGAPEDVFTPENLQSAYGECLKMVRTADGTLVVQDTPCSRGAR